MTLLLLPILGLITIFKLLKLTTISLWHDEAFSALLIQYDLKEMLYRISLDVHPPLYYLVLKGWAFFFNDSLFSLRLFSIFFGILIVLAIYFFIKEAFGNSKLALFSSFLVLLSSFQIQYDMEARMYTLGTFLIVISSFFLLKALKSKLWHWWFFYALAITAGIYTHYFVFFWIIGQGAYILYWLFRKAKFNLLAWLKNKNFQFSLAAYIFVIIAYLPWLGIFLRQLKQVQESYWIPSINLWSIPGTFFNMTTGVTIDPSRFWYVLVFLMIVVIVTIFYFLKKLKASAKWLIFLLLVIPFLTAVVLSLKTSIYLDRYFIFALPFYSALIAGAILSIELKFIRNTLIALVLLGSLVAFPVRWVTLEIEKKPGMAAIASYLNKEVKANDKIYVGSSFVYFTFKYYNQTGVRPLLYAPGSLAHFSGTALLSPDDVFSDFHQETKKDDIVWMLNTTGFGNFQPSLPDNWIKKEEKSFEDAYIYRGQIIATKYHVQ